MAASIVVNPTTIAVVSLPIFCNGIVAVTVGLYKDSTLRLGERRRFPFN